MKKYPMLFSPCKIGNLTLKNRIVMPPMGTSLALSTGELSHDIIEYYKERAKGGVGLITLEVSEINYENGSSALNSVRVDTSRCIPRMRRLADAVHVYGTKIFAQLHHGGNQSPSFVNDGHEMISASDVVSTAIGERPRALSNKEVKEYIQKYVFSALMAKMSKFDGVEIHSAHGYLPAQFISAHTNRRTDEYGGSFENRMRFLTEIIQGIKGACGEDFPISVRFSVDECTPTGWGLEEGVRIAKAIEAAGADALSTSAGTYESHPAGVDPAGFKQGWRVYMAEAVKKEVHIPVIAVGAIREPDYAESIIRDNKTDLVAIGRGLIADPEWCNKALRGQDEAIRKCISCMACIYNVLGCGYVCCSVNARAGHEAEYPHPIKNGNGREVLVVGGGPAGIEAARVSATRGFAVTLYEKGPALGGQLQAAKEAFDQERMNWYIDYANYELNRLGVDVKLNQTVDATTIKEKKPYALFMATGGTPIIPNVPGANAPNAVTAEDCLLGKISIENKKVVVVGGGITGSETASLLASKGNDVTLVEMLCDTCMDIFPDSRIELMRDMEKYGVKISVNTKLKEVKTGSVVVDDLDEGKAREIEADYIVFALGVKPSNELYNEICAEHDNIYLLGDAIKQSKIVDAVRTGHLCALELE